MKKGDQKAILESIKSIRQLTGWRLDDILALYGLKKNRYKNWKRKTERMDNQRIPRKNVNSVLVSEVEKILQYRQETEGHQKMGYKKLAWKMVDEDVAHLPPSAVYRILHEHGVLGKRNAERQPAKKEYEHKPQFVHHHWHTDIAYVSLSRRWYYLVFMLDGYSRCILHWELLSDMTSMSVELFTQKTLDKYPHARPAVIHDNGVQFKNRDFKRMLIANQCTDVAIRCYHPQSNGKAERFVGLAREEALRPQCPVYYAEAVQVIKNFVDFYNHKRYHAGIRYLKPIDVFLGKENAILEERKQKISIARLLRKEQNRKENAQFREKLPTKKTA